MNSGSHEYMMIISPQIMITWWMWIVSSSWYWFKYKSCYCCSDWIWFHEGNHLLLVYNVLYLNIIWRGHFFSKDWIVFSPKEDNEPCRVGNFFKQKRTLFFSFNYVRCNGAYSLWLYAMINLISLSNYLSFLTKKIFTPYETSSLVCSHGCHFVTHW